jgi:hypothetical protein
MWNNSATETLHVMWRLVFILLAVSKVCELAETPTTERSPAHVLTYCINHLSGDFRRKKCPEWSTIKLRLETKLLLESVTLTCTDILVLFCSWKAIRASQNVAWMRRLMLVNFNLAYNNLLGGHAVAQLVGELRYKPAGRGFESLWCHWNFSLT